MHDSPLLYGMNVWPLWTFFYCYTEVFLICCWSSLKEEVGVMKKSFGLYEWNRQLFLPLISSSSWFCWCYIFIFFFYIIASFEWVETFWMTTWVMHTNFALKNLCPYWRRLLHSMGMLCKCLSNRILTEVVVSILWILLICLTHSSTADFHHHVVRWQINFCTIRLRIENKSKKTFCWTTVRIFALTLLEKWMVWHGVVI